MNAPAGTAPAAAQPGGADGTDAEASPGGAAAGSALVVLRLGPAEYAVPVSAVREVVRPPPITRTPFAPPAVLGAVAIRGSILPVVDLGVRLFRAPARRPGALLVVRPGPAAEPVGLLVDAVTSLLEAGDADTRLPPVEAEATLPPGWVSAMLEPEPGRLVALLDVDRVLHPERAATADARPPEPSRDAP